jgi:hypothetical protein
MRASVLMLLGLHARIAAGKGSCFDACDQLEPDMDAMTKQCVEYMASIPLSSQSTQLQEACEQGFIIGT